MCCRELYDAIGYYNVEAVPITYAGSDGRQYVAANVSAPAGGEPRGSERLVVVRRTSNAAPFGDTVI